MAVAALPESRPADMQRRSSVLATLTIPARAGHRRILKEIFVEAPVANSFLDVQVGNVVLYRLYVGMARSVMVGTLQNKFSDVGFLRRLAQLIPDFPYPNAAEDEAITITASALPTRIDGYYEDVTGVDVSSKVVPGGSLSPRQLFIHNMTRDVAIGATANFGLNAALMPPGLDGYTDAIVTQAGQRFTCYVLVSNMPRNVGSRLARLHVFDEFTELFTSENAEGLSLDEGTAAAPLTLNELLWTWNPHRLFKLPTPYVFEPQHRLRFTVDCTWDGVNALAANSQLLFLVGIREYLGAV